MILLPLREERCICRVYCRDINQVPPFLPRIETLTSLSFARPSEFSISAIACSLIFCNFSFMVFSFSIILFIIYFTEITVDCLFLLYKNFLCNSLYSKKSPLQFPARDELISVTTLIPVSFIQALIFCLTCSLRHELNKYKSFIHEAPVRKFIS